MRSLATISSLLAAGLMGQITHASDAALRPWNEYRVIMWTGDTAHRQPEKLPLFYQRMREMGVNTGMVHRDGDPTSLVANQFPYYVENLVNRGLCLKWNSKVTDWDKFVTGWKDRRDEASLVRDYCLDDPEWRKWAREEVQRIVRKNVAYQPVLYNIRDELSVTTSANPFDYDFNPIALDAFRNWLQTQYPDVAALNRQWDTRFASWRDVKPFTTDQIKHRMAGGNPHPDPHPSDGRGRGIDWQALQRLKFDPRTAAASPARWNLSPWCDFRTAMDISLARALDDLRQAAHAIDPLTPVGIEGTQMPHAFGGYDLWRLSRVLDWVEPYDIGNAREIFGSFMPGKPILTTVFEKDTAHAMRRLWHLLLEGDKGCIIWWSEDCLDWKSADYPLSAKAKALAPVLKELTSPLARLFLNAEREHDPMAIHYSQPSIQVNWLLESTVDGSTWLRRFSSYEASHNRMAKTRNAWVKLLQDHGYTPRFVASTQIEQGELARKDYRLLVLPTSLSLSQQEISSIQSFVGRQSRRNLLAGDGYPGVFDDHGKVRPNPPQLGPVQPSNATGQDFVWVVGATPERGPHPNPLPSDGRGSSGWSGPQAELFSRKGEGGMMEPILKRIPREVVVPLESRTRVHRFRLGQARLLAFERNINYHMSEDLKQAGGNEALEKPVELVARLSRGWHVYDLRIKSYLGRTDTIRFVLDPWQPSLFALTSENIPVQNCMEFLVRQSKLSP